MIGQIGDRNFVNNFFDDYQEQINIGNIGDNVLQNAVTLSGQLANSIAIHVKNMLINIKNGMVNNHLNNQQLSTLIIDNVSYCINEVQDASHNVRLQLENNNNVLHQLDIEELSNENKLTRIAINSIDRNNEYLDALKLQYDLQ